MKTPHPGGIGPRPALRVSLSIAIAGILIAGSPGSEEPAMEPVSRHGFRYDPMVFVEEDAGLQGSLVRTFVFHRPREGDSDLLNAEIEKVFAGQKPDGSLRATSKETGSQLLSALQFGCPHDRPEVGRAADAILSQKRAGKNANEWIERDGATSIYALHALCLLGRSDVEDVRFSLKWFPEHQEMWNDP